MINLMPIEKRKIARRVFYARFAATLLAALGFAFLAAATALLPAYFAANVGLRVIQDSLDRETRSELSNEERAVSRVVEDLERRLDLLAALYESKYSVSERVIDGVILRKTDDIKIREITYGASPSGERLVGIRGSANTRDALLQFRVALERDPNWDRVDLPVSNFVRDRDIDFALTLTREGI